MFDHLNRFNKLWLNRHKKYCELHSQKPFACACICKTRLRLVLQHICALAKLQFLPSDTNNYCLYNFYMHLKKIYKNAILSGVAFDVVYLIESIIESRIKPIIPM